MDDSLCIAILCEILNDIADDRKLLFAQRASFCLGWRLVLSLYAGRVWTCRHHGGVSHSEVCDGADGIASEQCTLRFTLGTSTMLRDQLRDVLNNTVLLLSDSHGPCIVGPPQPKYADIWGCCASGPSVHSRHVHYFTRP